jgi:hypothetical protein
MKNWEPLVLGPALAMERIPGPVWRSYQVQYIVFSTPVIGLELERRIFDENALIFQLFIFKKYFCLIFSNLVRKFHEIRNKIANVLLLFLVL